MTAEQKASFEKNLAKMNEGLADYERVRRCVVLDRLFSLERGELTRTLKLRREAVEGVHRGLLRSLYETAVPQAILEIVPGKNVHGAHLA
ncbi:MAG: hypothetical protein IPN19_02670 [Elusimicrobia bacterium]|nr:hypothetical protein [Elusimicrobiota bacterium]